MKGDEKNIGMFDGFNFRDQSAISRLLTADVLSTPTVSRLLSQARLAATKEVKVRRRSKAAYAK